MKLSPPPLVIKSFAKLNLYLQILNKREDNFHNLNTLFCRIDLADTITLSNRKDSLIKIKSNSRQVPRDKTNLCWQAAELLRREFNLNSGLNIKIDKRIPLGAGLGGGSGNAASVLLGLNKYWKLNLVTAKLANLAAKIGSDVAFFIYNTKFAEAGGRGEKIKPLPSLNKLKLWFILVYPNIKVSTPLIYQKFDLKGLEKNQVAGLIPHLTSVQNDKKPNKKQGAGLTMRESNVRMFTSELLKKGRGFNAACLVNDLEVVTFSLYPVIKQVKKALSNIGLEKTMMSGSGAAIFSLCNNRKQAEDLSGQLAKEHKSWKFFVTSTV